MLSQFSVVHLFAALWTAACQAPLSMGFSRQEYWIGLPYPPPGAIPNPGIEPESPASPALQVDSLPTEPPGKPRERGQHCNSRSALLLQETSLSRDGPFPPSSLRVWAW